jgi:hypothetical protein
MALLRSSTVENPGESRAGTVAGRDFGFGAQRGSPGSTVLKMMKEESKD